MKNVINMRTKQSIESLPFDKEQAEKLIEYILKFKAPEQIYHSYIFMFESVLRHIMNNSGVDQEFVNNLVAKINKKSERA